MTKLHLIKLCVGVRDVAQLGDIQTRRLEQARLRGEEPRLIHVTRNRPRRAGEITKGGSIYWVIKGFVRVRQGIVAFDKVTNAEGRPSCALVFDENLVRTELMAFRPFQGWRYLSPDKAPPDARPNGNTFHGMPMDMAQELRALGLL
jgi:hypothetical protein